MYVDDRRLEPPEELVQPLVEVLELLLLAVGVGDGDGPVAVGQGLPALVGVVVDLVEEEEVLVFGRDHLGVLLVAVVEQVLPGKE